MPRLLLITVLVAISTAASAKSPAPKPEPASLEHGFKVGAIVPESAQIIAQPNNAYGIVIDQSRVLVVDPKSRKIVDILESGA